MDTQPKFSALAASIVDPRSVALATMSHSTRHKSPSKKLSQRLALEADKVFAAPQDMGVVRTWVRRVISRQFPQALSATDEQIRRIGYTAEMIGKLIGHTEAEKTDMLTRFGGYVVNNVTHKIDATNQTLRLKLDKQRLSVPSGTGFNSSAPTRITPDEDARRPSDRIARTRSRPGDR